MGVVIWLAVAALLGVEDVRVLGSTTCPEQLEIDVMEGLNNKALGTQTTTERKTTAGGRGETWGLVNVRRVAMTMAATHQVASH